MLECMLCMLCYSTTLLHTAVLLLQGCRFHRIVKAFCCQGGDIVRGGSILERFICTYAANAGH